MRRDGGFTLVELAIVLLIVALLVGMLMVPLGTQFDQARYSETQKHLDIAREAVVGFAIATGRLPCPATPTTATTSAVPVPGIENCALTEGVVPWAALGIPEADAWGRRLTYRVTAAWADAPGAGLLSSFAMTDNGDITVTNGAANIATTLPAVIVSHGKNGVGAFLTDGTQVGGATGDELQNANNNTTFVSRTHAPDFDDLVTWVSPNVLKTRMVAASRLP
jgi:prepilin-type N-terminal cleavage/methylation domain-containing protein